MDRQMIEILLLISLGYIAYDKQDEIKEQVNKVGLYQETEQRETEQYRIIDAGTQVNDTKLNKALDVIKSDECETEVTEIFYSKASGEITTCKGKLLEDGQKTRIVRVNK